MSQNHNETKFSRTCGTAIQCLAVAIPLLLLVHVPAHAADKTCEAVSTKGLDARLSAKADEGPASLRRYVDRTRMIHQLDVPTAMQRVEQRRDAVAACTTVASRS